MEIINIKESKLITTINNLKIKKKAFYKGTSRIIKIKTQIKIKESNNISMVLIQRLQKRKKLSQFPTAIQI